ncbi:alpha/beta hydrolase [Flexibacterium corallicola]|uniref:alpha/beta hydrolase n=1 Tax=Flexibacterium corallicola TaxID=3037259 RepID=UPI00286F3BCB|nr:alpha/beta hydrolase [Pseudovibrio sp. M1P-2-3]
MALFSTAFNPAPEGGSETYVTSYDGVKIRCAYWKPAVPLIKGTITIVQGFSEYIEKYFEVIEDLRQRGFHVVAFDFRGQGGSDRLLKDPLKGHVDSLDDFVADLTAVLDEVSLPNFPGPHYILSHSLGGAVTLLAHERLRTKIDRIVMTSPLIQAAEPQPVIIAARFLSRWLSLIGLGGAYVPGVSTDAFKPFQSNKLTSSVDRFSILERTLKEKSSLCVKAPTVGWIHAASESLLHFKKEVFGQSLTIPTLVIAAGSDQVISTSAIEELCRRSPVLGYLEIQGAKHDLMVEADRYRDQYWAAFDAFVPGSSD